MFSCIKTSGKIVLLLCTLMTIVLLSSCSKKQTKENISVNNSQDRVVELQQEIEEMQNDIEILNSNHKNKQEYIAQETDNKIKQALETNKCECPIYDTSQSEARIGTLENELAVIKKKIASLDYYVRKLNHSTVR